MANKQSTAKPNKQDIQDTRGSARKPVDDTSLQDNAPKASGHGGKVENDFNQTGDQKPTQRNEGQRTANSRNDRESHVGGSNQLQARRGTTGR